MGTEKKPTVSKNEGVKMDMLKAAKVPEHLKNTFKDINFNDKKEYPQIAIAKKNEYKIENKKQNLNDSDYKVEKPQFESKVYMVNNPEFKSDREKILERAGYSIDEIRGRAKTMENVPCYDDLYENCVQLWGEDSQVRQTVEEMGELTTALCKMMRYVKEPYPTNETSKKLEKAKEDVIEEIADVFNMIEQLSYMFGKEKIRKEREKKLGKLINHIHEERLRIKK